ncbi:MAG: hypothetical protein JO153_10160, partial [Solirubrobacterales bacterium]|nr:hypothetical protein [Solirubrobacterales bacterium]
MPAPRRLEQAAAPQPDPQPQDGSGRVRLRFLPGGEEVRVPSATTIFDAA